MSTDTILTITTISVISVGFVVWSIGGFLTPVAGAWQNDNKITILFQFGPKVWGYSETIHGRQRFSGFVSFRRLSLARRDSGRRHLMELGFSQQQAALVDGQVMMRLKLRYRNNQLAGNLWGTNFKFNTASTRVLSIHRIPLPSRTWVRIGGKGPFA